MMMMIPIAPLALMVCLAASARAQVPAESQPATSEPESRPASQPATAPAVPTSGPAQARPATQAPAKPETDRAPAREENQEEEPTIKERAVSLLKTFRPYVIIVGGIKGEFIQNRTDTEDHREDRVTTIALSRFGVLADFGEHVHLESEFEVNLGPHGTSVWEGQAALQVRQQFLRLSNWGAQLEAGRVIDDASIDYFSEHIADTFLKDSLVRESFLASGANLGNGLLARYELPWIPLRLQFTFNAANPVSMTGSLVVGGSYWPFGRVYIAPWQQVGRDASKYPADEFHIMIWTPALVFQHRWVQAKVATQFFDVNTKADRRDDAHIKGYNLRASLQVSPFGDWLRAYGNLSRVSNPIMDQNDLAKESGESFSGWTTSAGFTFNYWKNNGVGAHYSFIRDQEGGGVLTQRHYLNVGTTYHIWDAVAIGARFGMYIHNEYPADVTQPKVTFGERSFFLTLRTTLR